MNMKEQLSVIDDHLGEIMVICGKLLGPPSVEESILHSNLPISKQLVIYGLLTALVGKCSEASILRNQIISKIEENIERPNALLPPKPVY